MDTKLEALLGLIKEAIAEGKTVTIKADEITIGADEITASALEVTME